MTRKIKSKEITLDNGKPAVLSTLEVFPGKFETLLASPDFGIEYACLQSDSEQQAIADFNRIFNRYSLKPLSGRYAKLAKDLKSALSKSLKAASKSNDGGTCNLDSVMLNLPRWNQKKVGQAAKSAGMNCRKQRTGQYIFPIPCNYQGNARTIAARSMMAILDSIGYESDIFYQID